MRIPAGRAVTADAKRRSSTRASGEGVGSADCGAASWCSFSSTSGAGRLWSGSAGRARVGAAVSISSVFTFGRRLMTKPDGSVSMSTAVGGDENGRRGPYP
ncbi:hypothetical protein VPH35_069844 [Triticum aestivum]